MKADTYREFQKINHRLDLVIQLVTALADPNGDKVQLAAMLEDVKKRSAALRTALPAPTGSSAA